MTVNETRKRIAAVWIVKANAAAAPAIQLTPRLREVVNHRRLQTAIKRTSVSGRTAWAAAKKILPGREEREASEHGGGKIADQAERCKGGQRC